MLQFQLKSAVEIELATYQSLYSEIDSLHLQEVLSLVSSRHGQGELFVALKSSIERVMTMVNRRLYLQQRRTL